MKICNLFRKRYEEVCFYSSEFSEAFVGAQKTKLSSGSIDLVTQFLFSPTSFVLFYSCFCQVVVFTLHQS